MYSALGGGQKNSQIVDGNMLLPRSCTVTNLKGMISDHHKGVVASQKKVPI